MADALGGAWRLPGAQIALPQMSLCPASQELPPLLFCQTSHTRGAVMHVLRRISGMVASGGLLMSRSWP